MKEKLRCIAKAAGITSSDALRMAVNHGIPSLESGRLPLNQAQTKTEVPA
jgi:antitoxin component of RelBE/YafQ-DinJ toxin-antitoxin module